LTRRTFATLCGAVASTSVIFAQTDPADGWIDLFDSATTKGWLEITGKPFPANCWTLEDGCLRALVKTDGFQDIRTAETFRSFDLRFEWKLLKDGNSGVKYKIQKVDEWVSKEGRQARARGLEYQLADDTNPDAASDPRRVAGSLYSLIAPSPRVAPRIGEFNQSRIVVAGTHVEHWLNGQRVVAFETSAPEVAALLRKDMPKDDHGPVHEEGPISLQNHSSETWFRSLKIRRI
jgi:hypothetical protein